MHRALSVTLLVLAPGLAPPQGEPGGSWRDCELFGPMQLDLATGEVSNRPSAQGAAALGLREGRLSAPPGLLFTLPAPTDVGTARRIARDDGRPFEPEGAAEVGDELLYRLPDGRWGYLSVLARREGGLLLEHAPVAGDRTVLERDPARLTVATEAGETRLEWSAVEGAEYWIERAVVGTGETSRESVRGGTWSDPFPLGSRLVEYKVARAGAPLGNRVRAHRTVRGPEEDLPLQRGARIDLLTGEIDGPRGDLEVTYLNPPSVALRPMEGTGLEPLLGPGESWELPAPGAGRYLSDRIRTIDLATDVAVRLREGIYGRIRLRAGPDGRLTLRRQLELGGRLVLPQAPAAPEARWEPGGVHLTFPPLGPEVDDAGSVRILVEEEESLRGGEWREVAVTPPGVRALLLPRPGADAGAAPLLRVRFRQRTADGRTSDASEPLCVLLGDATDGAQVQTWLDRAFTDLVDGDFEQRLTARGVIAALGRAAWPRLEQALLDDDLELASAARDLLTSTAHEGGAQAELLLRAQAVREGAGEPHPAGLFDPDPLRRAWALAREWCSGDPAHADAWGAAVAHADPESVVALFADELLRSPRDAPRPLGRHALAEWHPRDRPQRVLPDPREVEDAGARALAGLLRRAVDVQEPRPAWVLLALADTLERAAEGGDEDLGRERDARLALSLVERWQAGGPAELFEAARALAGGPASELAAWRELTSSRLDAPAPPASRVALELSGPSWSELEARLAALASEGGGYVDLVLPPGSYAPPEGRGMLEIASSGVRLVAAGGGEVALREGVHVRDAVDVILEGISIESERGTPLSTSNARVLVRDARLSGAQTVIVAAGGGIELDRVLVTVPGDKSRPRWTARLGAGADFVARASLLEAGTIATSPGSNLYLELCVVDAGPQTAFQGQQGGDRLVLRDSLLRGEGLGIAAIEHGLAAAVVFDFARDAVLAGTGGVRLSPERVLFTERTPQPNADAYLERCPLERR